MNPEQYCQEKAVRSGSSFYYSFLFLPPQRRAAITALYAFCREVDDVVDETSDPSIARTTLEWWRTEVARLFQGAPTHPVTIALQPHLVPFSISREHLLEIILGMEMDLVQNRYPDFSALALYCHRVAGVVGLLAANIFGATQAETSLYAEKLGQAFQLTNIIRDVGEDALKGRIYLPLDELQRFNVEVADILERRYTPEFSLMMQFQAQRARDAYDAAFALLPAVDRRAQRPGIMMARIYRTLLEEIADEDFRVLHQRISLTPIRKLWLAWRSWISAR